MYKQILFASFSFGCRVNEAERIEMDRGMIAAGFVLDHKRPDLFIINSCAVTNKAEREVRQLIMKLKRDNPRLKLVVTGCAATYWKKNEMWKNIPIDLIISNNEKTSLITQIKEFLSNGQSQQTYSKTKLLRNEPIQQDKFISSGRIMVKIQDGCHRFCSYCIVPYLRGKPKSKKVHEVIKTVKESQQVNHINEVIYTAINTEAFGKDTSESLLQLIKESIDQIKVPRISFGSIHPWSITKEFLDYYRVNTAKKKLSDFFHVPIQSGSNKILKYMNRGYCIEDIEERLNEIQEINPFALIATDVIVGFPGETDKEFQNTYEALKHLPISKFHIFRFSSRRGTAADTLRKQLGEPTSQEKQSRARILTELGKKKYQEFLTELVGSTDTGLFIGKNKDELQQALLHNQIPVTIKTNKDLNGRMMQIKILEKKNERLFGVICGPDRT